MNPVVAEWGPMDRSALHLMEGHGAAAPPGFRAGGIAAGIKESGKPDLAVVIADRESTLAVSTTTNRVRAACCDVAAEHARSGTGRAVIINAGNANACTPQGREHAEQTCAAVASAMGTQDTDIVPMSTGIIGVPLPIEKVRQGIPQVVADASGDRHGGTRAAEAIMTTDNQVKQVAYEVMDEQGRCTIGAMAKGSGMIEPAMATMLAVISTDAPIPKSMLQPMLKQAVNRSFNRISVDGCGSTNDTVAMLASGAAIRPPSLAHVQAGMEAACADLAAMIVADGEGVTRVARLTIGNAANEQEADVLARAIGSSALFRAALHGGDPNWGRILAAMGATAVEFDPGKVSVTINGIDVCRFGVAATYDQGQAAQAMSGEQVDISVDVGMGTARATHLVGDLSSEYITINAEYHT